MSFERAKTRVERGLPAKPPKKPKAVKPRHDGYDPGHMPLPPSALNQSHHSGDPCPVPGCGLPIFEHGSRDNIRPCPLGRGCELIPARYV